MTISIAALGASGYVGAKYTPDALKKVLKRKEIVEKYNGLLAELDDLQSGVYNDRNSDRDLFLKLINEGQKSIEHLSATFPPIPDVHYRNIRNGLIPVPSLYDYKTVSLKEWDMYEKKCIKQLVDNCNGDIYTIQLY